MLRDAVVGILLLPGDLGIAVQLVAQDRVLLLIHCTDAIGIMVILWLIVHYQIFEDAPAFFEVLEGVITSSCRG